MSRNTLASGRDGGYALQARPSEISIGDIVRAAEHRIADAVPVDGR